MDVTPERFRALARSSPWRWSTLRFTWSRLPTGPHEHADVRAWLRRPGLLRVEDLDGQLVSVVRETPAASALLTRHGGLAAPPPVEPDGPTFRDDGLVDARPGMPYDHDAPMHQDYRWVAMLDPVELADGEAGAAGAAIDEIVAVEHHGRAAWEAVVRATASYQPRCPCCPLVPSAESDRREAQQGGISPWDTDPDFLPAEAHRVRLDVETGVCVFTVQLGGSREGWGHDLVIEAVDEPMDDELFVASAGARRRWGRRSTLS